MKKLVSILLVLALVLSFSAMASAATVPTAVVNNTGHMYHAHQIFSGTQAPGEAMLGSVEWGVGVDKTKENDLLAAVKAIRLADGTTPFASCENAEEVAAQLAISDQAYKYNTPRALAFAQVVNQYLSHTYTAISAEKNSTVSLEPGYYLLEDVTNANGKDDITGLSLLQITGDTIHINSKTDKPTVGKKVQDEAADRDLDSLDATAGWGETADHAINESFRFELVATIPSDTNLDQYKTYKVVFHDTMSQGVTFERIESVKINGVAITSADYVLSSNAVNGAAGITFTLTINDIKPLLNRASTAGEAAPAADNSVTIEVIYVAHLNENAVVATSRETVGTDGNYNDVYLQYSNNPNADGEGDMGQTTKDTVWVFTYKSENTKYKNAIQDVNKLAGAGFTLYTEAEYAKLIDNSEATTATPVYLLKHTDGYHYPVPAGTSGAITEMVTLADGAFDVKGLDTGVYYLVETKVPAGYNQCDDVKVEILAAHEEVNEVSATTHITMKKDDVAADDLRIDVINNAGATLPETGGIGTTIFYVAGAVLVLLAVVMLVTKKRMGAAE